MSHYRVLSKTLDGERRAGKPASPTEEDLDGNGSLILSTRHAIRRLLFAGAARAEAAQSLRARWGECERCHRPHGATLRCLPDGRWFYERRGAWHDGKGTAPAGPIWTACAGAVFLITMTIKSCIT